MSTRKAKPAIRDNALRVVSMCIVGFLCGQFAAIGLRGAPQPKEERSTKSHEVTQTDFASLRVDSWIVNASETSFNKHETDDLPYREIGFVGVLQGPDLDYATFKHTSQKHASLGCTACHQRAGDNSIKPAFPGHPACFGCHVNQLVNPVAPMCAICHTDLSGSRPPLKNFPTNFKESFNVKFDHAQHMTGAARPKNGCNACHDRQLNRGAALAIPTSLSAHTQCYSCHTPSSKSAAGRELASCGVCHDEKKFARTSTNALAFRESFSHIKHGPRQRLDCLACHTLSAGLPQGRQVSSPRASEHFPAGAGQSCASCHNGKRSFGGDLAFNDCRRCHTGSTFRLL